jgi:hypothetical protein
VRVRSTFPWLFAVLLAACSSATRAPIRRAVILPYATEKAMTAAVAEAPDFTITGAHLTAGTIIERYTRADGLEVIYVPEPDAAIFTLEAWWPVGWCSHPDPAKWTAALALSDLGNAPDPDLAGWRADSSVGCALSVRRVGASAKDALATGTKILTQLAPSGAAAIGLEARLAIAHHRALLGRTGVELEAPGAAPALLYYSGPHARSEVLLAAAALPAPAPKPEGAVPIGAYDRMLAVEAKGPPLLLMAWRLEDGGFEDRLHLEALARLLADGPESRLGRRLGPGLGTAARARFIPTAGAIELEVSVSLDATTTSTQAVERVRAEISSVAKGETTGLELERVKASMLAERLSALSSLDRRGQVAASALLLAHDLDEVALSIDALPDLEETSLRKTIAKTLAATRPGLVITREPKPKAEAK